MRENLSAPWYLILDASQGVRLDHLAMQRRRLTLGSPQGVRRVHQASQHQLKTTPLHSPMQMMKAHQEDEALTCLTEHVARGSPLALDQLTRQIGLASILDDRCACCEWVGRRHAGVNFANFTCDGGMHQLQQ